MRATIESLDVKDGQHLCIAVAERLMGAARGKPPEGRIWDVLRPYVDQGLMGVGHEKLYVLLATVMLEALQQISVEPAIVGIPAAPAGMFLVFDGQLRFDSEDAINGALVAKQPSPDRSTE